MERALARLNSVEVDREFATPEEAQQFLREELEKSNLPPPAPTELMQAEDLVDQGGGGAGAKAVEAGCGRLWRFVQTALMRIWRWRIAKRDMQKMRPLFERAVEAGRKMISAQAWEAGGREFWRRIETRPFMRAKMGLGEYLRAMNLPAEAAEHFEEMIRLNPADHQAVRYRLVATLLELNRQNELEELIEKFPKDRSALWSYARRAPGCRFRKEGDTKQRGRSWEMRWMPMGSCRSNLLKKKELPPAPPPSSGRAVKMRRW